MAHFAQLDEANIVTQVIVVNNDVVENQPFPQSEPAGVEFCQSLYGSETVWKQTSYNGNFRKHYAGIGFEYDAVRDAFIPPQPYPSWILNETTCLWDAPVPDPQDGGRYIWDEQTLSWIRLEQ